MDRTDIAPARAVARPHRLARWCRRGCATNGAANGKASCGRRPAFACGFGEAARRQSLVRHALGSFVDAFWIRQRDVADLQAIDDLRHGFRQWRQQAGFAITAVGILALSMAASVTAFSVVSQILLRPLPYHEPDRIVTLWERLPSTPGRSDVAPGNFLDWRARATSFTQLAGAEPYSFDYTGGDRPRGAQGDAGHRRLLRHLRHQAAGRTLLPARGTQEGQQPRRRA